MVLQTIAGCRLLNYMKGMIRAGRDLLALISTCVHRHPLQRIVHAAREDVPLSRSLQISRYYLASLRKAFMID